VSLKKGPTYNNLLAQSQKVKTQAKKCLLNFMSGRISD